MGNIRPEYKVLFVDLVAFLGVADLKASDMTLLSSTNTH